MHPGFAIARVHLGAPELCPSDWRGGVPQGEPWTGLMRPRAPDGYGVLLRQVDYTQRRATDAFVHTPRGTGRTDVPGARCRLPKKANGDSLK
jgi:hypothetical protein